MALPTHTVAIRHQQVPSLGGMQASAHASDYILEQRTQKRYRYLLRESLDGPEELDRLLEQSFPDYFALAHTRRDPCQVYWQAETRVEHDIPELITCLSRPDLERVAALLAQADLAGCIRLVWYELRSVLHKTMPAERLPDDSRLHQAAGLGKLGRELCRPTRKADDLVEEESTSDPVHPLDLPIIRPAPTPPLAPEHQAAAAAAPQPSSPPARPRLRPRRSQPAVHQQVRRAQERKRLKRKHRR